MYYMVLYKTPVGQINPSASSGCEQRRTTVGDFLRQISNIIVWLVAKGKQKIIYI